MVRRPVRARRRRHADDGTVTAETALALPGVVLVLAVVLASGHALVEQVRCVDAARAGARLAARGEPQERTVAEALRLGPDGGRAAIVADGTRVTVRVSGSVRLPLGIRLPVEAVAVADREVP